MYKSELVKKCREIRNSSNYQGIKNFPVGKNSGVDMKIDAEVFEKRAEDVAERLKNALYKVTA